MQAVDTIDGIITAPQVYSAGTYIPHLTLHRPYLALPGWEQKWKWLKTPLACCGETHIMTLVYTMAWHASHSLSLTDNVKVAHVASS
jgi:hypothetical protein